MVDLKQKTIYIVLGMHRSGTSAMARGLEALGVSLGDQLMPAARDNNDKGFWEDIEINALNDKLLEALGIDWQSVAILNADEFNPIFDNFFPEAKQILLDRFAKSDNFGVKDPRISRLLPFWLPVFNQLRLEAKFIIAVRNPLSVVHSLAKRDQFEPEKSYLLWLLHSYDSILYTDRFERVIIDYDQFLNEPKKQLQIISNQLALHFDQQSTSVKEFEEEFLDLSLRHNFFSKNELKNDPCCPDYICEFYNALLESASTQVISNKHLVDIVEPFIRQRNLINFFANSEINRRKLNGLLSRKTLECENVIEKSESRQATIEEQHKMLVERQALMEQQHTNMYDLQQSVEEQHKELVERQALMEQQHANLRELKQSVLQLKKVIDEKSHQIRFEINAKAQNSLKIEQQQKQLERQERQISNQSKQIRNQSKQIKYLERQVASIYVSRSWRSTKPLRSVTNWFRFLLRQVKRILLLILHKLWELLRKRPAARRFIKRFLFKLSPKLYNRMLTTAADRSKQQSTIKQPVHVSTLISSTGLPEATQAPGSLAVHVHMYYPDLCGEFVDYLDNVPFAFDCYISVPNSDAKITCENAFKPITNLRKLDVRVVKNRGRDIAPMVTEFSKDLLNYDFIAHIQSKKSLYNSGATDGWRKYLLDHLFGSEQQVKRVLHLLAGKEYGIVYPQSYYRVTYAAHTWLANRGVAEKYKERVGVRQLPGAYFDFPCGSMFWAKKDALAPLLASNFTLNDFPAEEGQTDGTLAHTIERFLGVVPSSHGYQHAILRDHQLPRWSPRNFQQYIARDNAYVRGQLENPEIKAVIFDVFDTLVSRPLLEPESTKTIIALNLPDKLAQAFKKYRRKAEHLARTQAGKDVDIEIIYQVFQRLSELKEREIDQIKGLEISIEKGFPKVRSECAEIFQFAKMQGKKIIIASDFFLPEKDVADILHNNGIDNWDSIYVSSTVGLRKDTGELFKHILEKEQLSARQVVMIGDNERSDLQIPADSGMTALHVLKHRDLAFEIPRLQEIVKSSVEKGSIHSEITMGLITRACYDYIFYPKFKPDQLIPASLLHIGYAIAGPLLVSFSQWLKQKSIEHNIGTLWFLSREGDILKQVFDKLYSNANNPITQYLRVSRRAVLVPSIKDTSDIERLASDDYYCNSVRNYLFERYGLMLSSKRWDVLQTECGLCADDTIEIKNRNISAIRSLLKALEVDILSQAEAEKTALLAYLESVGFSALDETAVVDIGYSGTMQYYLSNLTNKAVGGLYLMTNTTATDKANKVGSFALGAVYNDLDLSIRPLPPLYKHNFSFEMLLSSNEAQLLCYQHQDNKTIGVFRDLSKLEIDSQSARDELREGIFQFVNDLISVKEVVRFTPNVDMELATAMASEFFNNANSDDVQLINRLAVDDHFSGRGVIGHSPN